MIIRVYMRDYNFCFVLIDLYNGFYENCLYNGFYVDCFL